MNYYRAVRGDGNCFYRAAGFNYLENLFLLNDNLLKLTGRLADIKK